MGAVIDLRHPARCVLTGNLCTTETDIVSLELFVWLRHASKGVVPQRQKYAKNTESAPPTSSTAHEAGSIMWWGTLQAPQD